VTQSLMTAAGLRHQLIQSVIQSVRAERLEDL